jgi:hypothetical protein
METAISFNFSAGTVGPRPIVTRLSIPAKLATA